MIHHKISRLHQAGPARAALKVAAIAAAVALCAAPSGAAIGIGTVTSDAPAGGVPRFGRFEAVFTVNTGAASPYLPYDPSAPPYAARLHPNEDARRGVSVDALLMPPGQTDWRRAQTWPCYWQEDFTASGIPTGASGWHLRFAPTQVGTWHYELRAADASGSVTTAPAAFNCVPSASKGFVHISPTDGRYFEFSDGSPFIAAGANAAYGPEADAIMSGLHGGGGTGLLRTWVSTQGGIGVVGGFNLDSEAQGFAAYSGHVTTEDAHTGRFCLSIPVPSGFGPQVFVYDTPPGEALTLTAYIKGVGESRPPALWTSFGVCANVGGPDARGWQKVTVSGNTGPGGTRQVGLGDYGNSTGHLLVDDIAVTNPAGGDWLGGGGSFEWHTNYNQAAAARLDGLVSSAQAQGQFLKLVCLNKFDNAFGSVQNDGSSTTNWSPPNQALGGSTDPNADTPVQRLQRYWARYLVARWGYSVALHSLEYTNEMDDYNGVQYAGAQAFARAAHAYSRDGTALGRLLVTSSTTFNSGGGTYDPGFFENPATYPDIDYKDYHCYPDSSDATRGPALPYDDPGNIYNCFGSVRHTGGGPGGLGRLTFSLATQDTSSPYNLTARFPLPALHGRGTWTVTYWLRKDAAAVASNPQASINDNYFPGGFIQFPAGGLTAPTTAWKEYSGTFHILDDGYHQGMMLHLGAYLSQHTPPGTTVEFGDVRIIAPDGTVFYRLSFSEPDMARDSASLASYLAGGKATFSGGGDTKPFVVGETQVSGPISASLGLDGAGVYARQAFWGGALSAYAQITQFWHESVARISANDGWKYEGGVERFLAGVPLSNGHYRDLDAVVSPTLRVVGQKDVQADRAVFWVQNRGAVGDGSDAANWYNLATNPAGCAPASGTVAIPGLLDGSYEADVWNTSSGQLADSLPLTTSGGVLTVPISDLDADAAVKIFPTASARMALRLTSDHSTVTTGGTVTFTLTYVNQGTSPALGVSLPWPVPDHTRFVSASGGGSYDAAENTVTWRIGTVPAGGSGSVTLTVTVE